MVKKVLMLLVLAMSLGACLAGQQAVTGKKYPKIIDNDLIFYGDKCDWDKDAVHTFSIVEANKDGYKYWAYYGLDHYNVRDPHIRKGGLARSNDLENWEKYDFNPIINSNCRWPTVVYRDGTFYMFYAEYNDDVDSQIVMVSSDNGIDFGNKVVIAPYVKGEQNQNPFIYFDERDQHFYLFYYNGTERAKSDKRWSIYLKKSADIGGLKSAKPTEVLTSKGTMAAPSVAFYNNTYYLLVEEFNDSKAQDRWVTNAFFSDRIDGGYKRVENNPILWNNDACAFQYVFDGKLYFTYSHALKLSASKWNLRMVKLQ